jgi:hypothetical protein
MSARDFIEQLFPKLKGTGWEIRSPLDHRYNCVAWVVDDKKKWWEPDPMNQYYWPSGLRRNDYSVEAYKDMFENLGYESSSGEEGEKGYVKIALFSKGTLFKHVSWQRESGIWTSKLGKLQDIDHLLGSLSGSIYGSPTIFLRKSVS